MFFKLIYLPFLAKTRIRRRCAKGTKGTRELSALELSALDPDIDIICRDTELNMSNANIIYSSSIPDTPIKPQRFFLPLFADDSDDEPSTAEPIDKTNSDDEYVVSDIELTDELIAMLDKTYSPPVSPDSDEYVVSDIELTDELIAILDKTYSPLVSPDSDEYVVSDIELTDELIAVLDNPLLFPDSDGEYDVVSDIELD
jgi:hypothetical protein